MRRWCGAFTHNYKRSLVMPMIKAGNHKTVKHPCRLLEPNRDVLVLYARFIGDTTNYVTDQMIEMTIAKDREFLAWRLKHPNEPIFLPKRRGKAIASEAPVETARR